MCIYNRAECAAVVFTKCAFGNTPGVNLVIRRMRILQYAGCEFSKCTAGADAAFIGCVLGCHAECTDLVFTECALRHAIIAGTSGVHFGTLQV